MLTVLPCAATLLAVTEGQPPRRSEEVVDVLGRAFVLLMEGPMPPGRFEVRIWEGTRRGPGPAQYLRAPIRGRDADEARERALEVLHNYVGLDQFRLAVEEVAAELAPGARVSIRETAREVIVTVEAPGHPKPPLAIRREQILAPDASFESLRVAIRRHLGVPG